MGIPTACRSPLRSPHGLHQAAVSIKALIGGQCRLLCRFVLIPDLKAPPISDSGAGSDGSVKQEGATSSPEVQRVLFVGSG
jgi:hypothetical protein